jgi:hypothetical protein
MLPAPNLIRQCGQCQKPFAQPTLRSGNTIGATFWTDGKREALVATGSVLRTRASPAGTILRVIVALHAFGVPNPWQPAKGIRRE